MPKENKKLTNENTARQIYENLKIFFGNSAANLLAATDCLGTSGVADAFRETGNSTLANFVDSVGASAGFPASSEQKIEESEREM